MTLRRAVLFGARNRAAGWSMGLSILTCLANVLPDLNEDDRPLALYQGVTQVATSTSGQPPRFDLRPMETSNRDPSVYLDWFRRFVEVRSPAATERCLRTAIDIGLDQPEIADVDRHIDMGQGLQEPIEDLRAHSLERTFAFATSAHAVDHLVALAFESGDQATPDEAGSSCDEGSHGRRLPDGLGLRNSRWRVDPAASER